MHVFFFGSNSLFLSNRQICDYYLYKDEQKKKKLLTGEYIGYIILYCTRKRIKIKYNVYFCICANVFVKSKGLTEYIIALENIRDSDLREGQMYISGQLLTGAVTGILPV